ncbi:glycine cleavage system protein H [Fundicoccus sp. Sow4_F4]|uniref:glycine cleavage system protein H n=1 Tax=Fundicoccus sp. Sow4_F4 TaxID=3438783 RepID=UPI003F92D8CF
MIKEINQLWVQAGDKIDGEVIYTIGLSSQLQDEVGDISFASIADLGAIEADETLLNVEASKAAIEIPAPFSGTIIERHETAEETTSLLDSPDQTSNWLVRMTASEANAFASL